MAEHDDGVALELRSRETFETENEQEREMTACSELGPVDGGRKAWTVLIAGIVYEAVFWGGPIYD